MSVTSNRIENTTTFSAHHKPILLALEYIGGGEFAIRYSCKDSALWHEIKDVMMSYPSADRRWDPDQWCAGKYGCWIVSEYVLDELKHYFPSIPAWLQKLNGPAGGQEQEQKREIQECPF